MNISLSFALGALVAGCVLVTGCHPSGTASAPPAMPPADVSVLTLKEEPVTLRTELPGRTSAFRVAEVRPQVNGVLQKRLFTEGADVQEGQQLYQIDAAPYQAALDTAQATMAHANAALINANLTLERDKGLLAAHAVSKQDMDTATATYAEAQADIAAATAAIETAKINLNYTQVLSPIAGRTGRSVTEGALVTTDQTSPLVTIQQLNPIYVDVSQSTAVVLRLEQELAAGRLKTGGPTQAQVKLVLEDGTSFGQTGQLQFLDANVDQSTGSVILRVVFPNPNDLLLPGMFVRAEVEEGVVEKGILVPQQALTHNLKGDATTLVVTADNKVALRTLKTVRAIGTDWLVSSGVAAGDRVIMEGIQKAAPGATVNPTEWTPPAASPETTPTVSQP